MQARPLIVAHRGGAPTDIENSKTAFVHGLQVGSDLIECDVRMAADGQLVLFHDDRMNGVPVGVLDVAQLRQEAPWLMTVGDFVAWQSGLDPRPWIVLDLKERSIDRALAPFLADPELRGRVIVTTQHMASIRRLSARYPDMRLGLSRGHAAAGARPARLRPWLERLLRSFWFHWLILQLRWCRANTAVLHHGLATRTNIRRFRRAGLRV